MDPHPRPFVSLEDISLRLYGKELFEHTSWRILDGQHWAVTGTNGSGKTTLMRAICGQVPAIRGRIVYHFMGDGALPRKHIALVSFDAQERTLRREGRFHQARWNVGSRDHALPVSEYLSESSVRRINPFQVLDETSDPAHFLAHRDRIVNLLGIQPLLAKELIQLSNGERRKITLARALLKRPRLLILDNPFSGLDGEFRHRLRNIIEELTQHDMQVIVVTARPDEIPPSMTHVLQIDRCQVVAQGRRDEISVGSSTAGHALEADRESASSQVALARPAPCTPSLPLGEAKPAHAPALVRMRNVHVSYGDAQILNGIDWTIRKGEHWALLGPNGSGKTTLLSVVLGDHPQAYANDISLFGRRRGSGESIWEIKQHIGHVSPELHLYYPKRISCLDVVCSGFFDSVGLYASCSQQQRQVASEWLAQLGLQSCAEALFAALSEGEQRLVLLARALVKHPLLLVLDEPCQGLDDHNKQRIRRVVDAIGQQVETSIIYVTHDTDELPQVITHILCLKEGKVMDRHPAHRAIASCQKS